MNDKAKMIFDNLSADEKRLFGASMLAARAVPIEKWKHPFGFGVTKILREKAKDLSDKDFMNSAYEILEYFQNNTKITFLASIENEVSGFNAKELRFFICALLTIELAERAEIEKYSEYIANHLFDIVAEKHNLTFDEEVKEHGTELESRMAEIVQFLKTKEISFLVK